MTSVSALGRLYNDAYNYWIKAIKLHNFKNLFEYESSI